MAVPQIDPSSTPNRIPELTLTLATVLLFCCSRCCSKYSTKPKEPFSPLEEATVAMGRDATYPALAQVARRRAPSPWYLRKRWVDGNVLPSLANLVDGLLHDEWLQKLDKRDKMWRLKKNTGGGSSKNGNVSLLVRFGHFVDKSCSWLRGRGLSSRPFSSDSQFVHRLHNSLENL